MNQPTTFLERVQPAIDTLPDGPDKDKLLVLAEAQDIIERGDVHPKQRALAMRRLLGGAATTGEKALRRQANGRVKKP
ncbi:MAG: hypothetical protein OHM77_07240 [Candidatus Nitricoxidivorans perseverans]|jgi:hypothetical protein|uniref:Uncharacterized protein n=1 Tax=Candidatus Nitricoxidivorans perseverans TaxID=2975601 RepID=A0AA49FJ19_9PROT|nr:MAG: hypothetical protein OHM77_07240 [Candidatus Nitricoxidivorans perseverans]